MAQKVRMVVWFDNDNLTPDEAMRRLGDLGKAIRSSELPFNPKWIIADMDDMSQIDMTLDDVVDVYNSTPEAYNIWMKNREQRDDPAHP